MVRVPSRPVLGIALGVLLLANPLYVGHFHLDDPNWYRYQPAEVTHGEDGLDVPIRAFDDGVDDDVACVRDDHPTRACALERVVYDDGSLTAPVGWGEVFIDTYGEHGYQYVYVDDAFHAVEAHEVGGETVLSLNRTPADEAMADVATPIDRADPQIQRAIRTGSATTHQPVDGVNQLVRDGDTYYTVYRAAAHIESGPHTLANLLELGVTIFGMGVGLWLVLRGQRRRVEHERRD
jgi:hypothetical protein